jgi:hypothetical protein
MISWRLVDRSIQLGLNTPSGVGRPGDSDQENGRWDFYPHRPFRSAQKRSQRQNPNLDIALAAQALNADQQGKPTDEHRPRGGFGSDESHRGRIARRRDGKGARIGGPIVLD